MRGVLAFIALCAVAGAAWCDGARPLAPDEEVRGGLAVFRDKNPDVAKGLVLSFEFIGHTGRIFEVGEETKLKAVASKDTWLHIFEVDQGGMAPVWPVPLVNPDLPKGKAPLNIPGVTDRPLFIKAHEPLVIPDSIDQRIAAVQPGTPPAHFAPWTVGPSLLILIATPAEVNLLPGNLATEGATKGAYNAEHAGRMFNAIMDNLARMFPQGGYDVKVEAFDVVPNDLETPPTTVPPAASSMPAGGAPLAPPSTPVLQYSWDLLSLAGKKRYTVLAPPSPDGSRIRICAFSVSTSTHHTPMRRAEVVTDRLNVLLLKYGIAIEKSPQDIFVRENADGSYGVCFHLRGRAPQEEDPYLLFSVYAADAKDWDPNSTGDRDGAYKLAALFREWLKNPISQSARLAP